MNTSPAPDVDRVLDRMGHAGFGYRSFPRPADDPAQAGFIAETPMPNAAPHLPPTGTMFSLVGDALPDSAAPPFAAPSFAVAAPMPVEQPAAFAAHAQPPTAPMPAPVARAISLTAMFRVLTGSPDPAPSHGDFAGREPAFPFRRG